MTRLGLLFVTSILSMSALGCRTTTVDVDYPIKAYARNNAHTAHDSVWTSYNVIYGYQNMKRVRAIREDLKPEDNEALRVYCTINPTVAYYREPPKWERDLAKTDPQAAVNVACWDNDWYLRDEEGEPLPKWQPGGPWYAVDMSDSCEARTWMCGPLLKIMEKCKGTFDGFIMEDGPEKGFWHYMWKGRVMMGDQALGRQEYIEANLPAYHAFLDEFVLALGKKKFIMLVNGHMVLPDCPSYEPAKWDVFSGAKLESFVYGWGGCPGDNPEAWWAAYKGVEENYGPARTIESADPYQGWDVSVCQVELGGVSEDALREVRLGIALCLMGDAACSISERGNHHGGEPSQTPMEWHLTLGKPVGPVERTRDGLLVRWFEHGLVKVNVNAYEIACVPAHDAVWEMFEEQAWFNWHRVAQWVYEHVYGDREDHAPGGGGGDAG